MTRKYFAALLILLASCVSAEAETVYNFPPEIEQYNVLLKKIESSKKKQSLKPLFYILTTYIFNKQINSDLLDKTEEYDQFLLGLKKNFIGIGYYEQDGAIFAVPDAKFLLNLAKTHGTDEDIEFFKIYSKFVNEENPDQDHPYMNRGDEHFTICTNFSSPQIYDFYHDWIWYIGTYPYQDNRDLYRSYASDLLSQYQMNLEGNTCSSYGEDDTSKKDIQNLIKNLTLDTSDNAFSLKLIDILKEKLKP
jgi:hypothetical protein